MEPDSCTVLTNQGRPDKPDVRVCRLPDLKRKINSRRTTAMDTGQNVVSVNDIGGWERAGQTAAGVLLGGRQGWGALRRC